MIQIDDLHTLLTRFKLKGNFDLFLWYFIYTISFEQRETLKYFSSIYHLERGKRQKAKVAFLCRFVIKNLDIFLLIDKYSWLKYEFKINKEYNE